ncbi:MAG: hypothetical protein EXR47_00245 [Dehalococcoidia bacterium]|nr:hypothetical protein [Dehalococcoidia bacterium]
MRSSKKVFPVAVAVLLSIAALWPGLALAHEQRDVGPYHLVVGFIGEPAIEGEKNGVDLRITKGGQPLQGAEKTLKVEITHVPTGVKKSFDLRTIFRDPGHYTADLIPTAPGQYQFRFSGAIETTQVNETFLSGPDRFGDVDPAKALKFPQPLPTLTALQEQAAQAQVDAAKAKTVADGAGRSGMVVGIIGIAVGGVALIRSRKA